MNHVMKNMYRHQGFTIVELMLAMLIGIIIMGGVMQMFMTTRDTQRTSEDQMQLVADARFAMDTISFDLRHAGVWGGTNETKLIACNTGAADLSCSDPVSAATNDCAANWYSNLSTPVIAFNDNNPYTATCATQGYKAGTDVLGVHYADSTPIPTGTDPGELASGVMYIRSNILGGQLFEGNTVPASTSVRRWNDNTVSINYVLRSPLYYVSDYTNTPGDGIPSLHRVELDAGPEMVDKVLIPGVEDLQLEFGLDTTGDFQVNTYVDAGSVVDANLGTNWENGRVVAVKIWLLMRAMKADRDGVGGSQTFTLAGKTPVTYNDGVRRFLTTSVVRLRNTIRRDLTRAGG